jgi:hypothetical protein
VLALGADVGPRGRQQVLEVGAAYVSGEGRPDRAEGFRESAECVERAAAILARVSPSHTGLRNSQSAAWLRMAANGSVDCLRLTAETSAIASTVLAPIE